MNKLNMPPQAVMTTRLLIGIYLLYADYSAFDDVMRMEGGKRVGLLIVLGILLVAGIALIVLSAMQLWKNWRDGSKEPTGEEPENEEK